MSIRTFILNRARLRAGLALGVASEMFRDPGSVYVMNRLAKISPNQNKHSVSADDEHCG